MKLLTGLGNPGIKYSLTRHNIGFMIIDALADKLNVRLQNESELWDGGFCNINGEDVYLMKPKTFMNRSGEAVGEFIDEHELEFCDILIVTDDFNLPLGTIRVRPKGSDGGHNGLADINYFLQSDEFPRMRVGIGKEDLTKEDYVDFVLGNFDEAELKVIKDLMPVCVDCAMQFVTSDLLNVMSKFNKSHLNS